MAKLLARDFIEKALEEINKTREEILSETKLDSQPHFIPLNEDILVKTLQNKFVKSYSVERFLQDLDKHYLSKAAKKELISKEGKLYYNNTVVTPFDIRSVTPAKVKENGKLIGILFAAKDSFASAQTSLFNGFLNKYVAKYLKGVRTLKDSQLGFDVGHVYFGPEQESVLGKSPSGIIADKALEQVSKAADNFYASDNLSTTQINAFQNLFNKASVAVQNFRVHTTYAQTIQQSLSKSFSDSLLSVNANIVIIQEQSENRGKFGSDERRYVEAIRRALKSTPLVELHFSKSFAEEVDARIMASLTGKKVSSTQKSVKHSTTRSKSSTIGATSKKLDSSVKVRNLETKRLIGLDRLLALLNLHLQDVVSANMGDGNERRILNYRTGRFAASAKVERLSASRSGLITAFYSYMKNPYATFAAGGRQQYPKTRDPRLLIGQSIRDIAAKYVAEKLRAVNV